MKNRRKRKGEEYEKEEKKKRRKRRRRIIRAFKKLFIKKEIQALLIFVSYLIFLWSLGSPRN